MADGTLPVVYVAIWPEVKRTPILDVIKNFNIRVLDYSRPAGRPKTLDNIVVKEFESGDLAEEVEILYAELVVAAKYRHKLKNLKWLNITSNGVDSWYKHVPPDEPKPTFILTKTPGSINAVWTAEYILGHILNREKNIAAALEAQKEKKWKSPELSSSRTLSEVTIGLLGVGGIGRGVARVCKAVGMTVWGLTRRPVTPETRSPDVDFYRTTGDLAQVLENCDYICSVLPSTPATRGLLSGDVLSHCQHKKGVFMNLARGDVIDEGSIIRALNNGWIGGAILDASPSEPLPEASPLWSAPGVTITPHISSWSLSPTFRSKLARGFLDNYQRYVKGEQLLYTYDWQQGY